MQKLLVAKNSGRIILLLQILQIIAHSRQTKLVCSKGLQFHYNPIETDRLNNIYQYILNNFSKEITLDQIAKVAHISPHSFCRYFKSRIIIIFQTSIATLNQLFRKPLWNIEKIMNKSNQNPFQFKNKILSLQNNKAS